MAPELRVNEVGSVQSQGDLRAGVERSVDQQLRERYGDGFFGQMMAGLYRESLVNDQVRAEMQMDATVLARGGSVRSAPPIPTMNYMGIPHDEIKAGVTEQADPGQVGQVGDAWVAVGDYLIASQTVFSNAITSSEFEWRGSAGDGARQFMAGIGNYVGDAGSSAQLAGRQAQLHSDALSTARTMPDPVPFDMDAANRDLQSTTDPFEFMRKVEQHEVDYNKSQQAHQQAADAASTFDQSVSGASTMPAFAAPPAMGGGSEPPQPPIVEPGQQPPKPGQRVPQVRGPGSGPGPGGPGPVTGQGPGPGQPAPVVGGPGSQSVNQQSFGGGDGVSPKYPHQYGQGPGTGPGDGGQSPMMPPVGGAPMGPGFSGDGSSAGRGTGGGRPGGSPGPGGSRGGLGGPGSAGPGTGGPRTGAPGSDGPGSGARTGSGPGAAAVEHATGASRGGAAGGRGAAGMGGMGAGGRGQGGEDTEHETASYLVEPDPESIFGTDQVTAPPVIGA